MPRYLRKVIQIRAVDSPNVRLALDQQAAGLEPSGEIKVPGVLSWSEYQRRRLMWDPIRQCVGLDACFYEGAALYLFPREWLDAAEALADQLASRPLYNAWLHVSKQPEARRAKGGGCDPAEGGDKTSMAAVDEYGVLDLVSKQTPDTSQIPGEALAFMRKHGLTPEQFAFDRGGGGKQHADRLRAMGHPVRTVAFGESVTPVVKRGVTPVSEQRDAKEDRYVYKNRRVEMYHELSLLMNPATPMPRGEVVAAGFGIPRQYAELRRQLAPIPLLYDGEGRLELPPKQRRDGEGGRMKTLVELIGHSPDEADSVVLACHAMLHPDRKVVVGPLW